MIIKYKNKIVIIAVLVVWIGLSVACWCKSEKDYSVSERRVLAGFPNLSFETIIDGSFAKEFETYTLDQFPLRDEFRKIKAVSVLGLFQQNDNNGLYLENGYISKIEYPMNEDMLEYAGEKFVSLYEKYMENTNVKLYFSLVPDKNFFLAKENGYLSMDYESFEEKMKQQTAYMEYIDIMHLLKIDDYYKTDTHWKQEKIIDVADAIANEMGASIYTDYEMEKLEAPFYGVYYGQAALSVKADEIYYLTNENLNDCIVTSYDTGNPIEKSVYDMEKAYGKDAYEIFLSGSDALLTIENPNTTSGRELIVFRDSFASSLVPLLIKDYQKITLVDIRYLNSDILGNFIDFDDQDVLFLYSTLVLNNSTSFK